MRRHVIALILVMVAASLVACAGSTPPVETGTPVPAAGTPAPAGVAESGANGDILSPLPGGAGAAFPTDAASIPKLVVDNLTAKKPMMIYWYDPTAKVTKDQRAEIDSVMGTYGGDITLFAFDYTSGIPVGSTTTSLPAEIDKAERMTGLLDVSTTPYIVFVNSAGTITYRFSGFADRGLIKYQVEKAIQ